MESVQSSTSSSDILASLNAQTKSGNNQLLSTTEEVQNRFLKLLVTQLKNQDPLNPLDNAAVTSQISQINTVTGIERLNTTLETLLSTFNEGQAVQAAGLIGKNVLVGGSGLALVNGQANGGVNLADACRQRDADDFRCWRQRHSERAPRRPRRRQLCVHLGWDDCSGHPCARWHLSFHGERGAR
jgi:flagellar basal-body rod modification protein FlgD